MTERPGVVSIVVSIHPDTVRHCQYAIGADRARCHSKTDKMSDFPPLQCLL